MQVTLCNRNHPEYGVATIPLPIPNEEYDNCISLLEKLEIGDVTAHDCYLDQIADAPISLHFLEGTMINVDELDFLARSLDRYTDMEMAQFQCMVATRENWMCRRSLTSPSPAIWLQSSRTFPSSTKWAKTTISQ